MAARFATLGPLDVKPVLEGDWDVDFLDQFVKPGRGLSLRLSSSSCIILAASCSSESATLRSPERCILEEAAFRARDERRGYTILRSPSAGR
jgi:hypothetical protein